MARATARHRRVVLHLEAAVVIVELQVRPVDAYALTAFLGELLLIHPDVPGANALEILDIRLDLRVLAWAGTDGTVELTEPGDFRADVDILGKARARGHWPCRVVAREGLDQSR